jgi:hypothetical protein
MTNQRVKTKRQNSAFFTRLLVILLFGAGLLLFFISPNRNSFKVAEPKESIVYRDQSASPFNFRAFLHLLPPDTTDEGNQLKIELKSLEYDLTNYDPGDLAAKKKFEQEQLCIQSIVIFQTAAESESGAPANADMHKYWSQDQDGLLCGEVAADTLVFDLGKDEGDLIASSFNAPDTFWYPFDDFSYDFYMEVYYIIIPKDVKEGDELKLLGVGSDEVSRYVFTFDSISWNYSPEPSVVYWEYTRWDFMRLNLTRTFSAKVLPFGLVGIILMLIASMTFVDKFSELLEPSIAIIFGIYGLKQLVIPEGIRIQTVWDYAVILLVVCFMFALGVRFWKYRQTNLNLPQQDESPSQYLANKATKVVHITTCKWANNIAQNNLVKFSDLDAAIGNGYRQCPFCLPIHKQ